MSLPSWEFRTLFLPRNEIKEMKEVFDLIDGDGSGEISFDEMRELMRVVGMDTDPARVQVIMNEVDTDGSGDVDFGEFAAIMLRPSLLRDFQDKGMVLTKDDCWLFSQWSGYKATPEYQKVEQAFAAVGATMGQVHTSGHASLDDLVDFSESLAPGRMIPIHSDVWDQHLHRFSNVHRLMDNVPLAL